MQERIPYMKFIFVINPAAGRAEDISPLKQKIQALALSSGKDIDIYETLSVGDAEVFTRNTLEDYRDEICFIACGGDGTFSEVLNGCMGHPNAVCSVYPMGTGNDFVRNFPDAGDFTDIEALLSGNIIPCDAIEYSGVIDGEFKTAYCANMFNIGFDCNVVDKTNDLKRKPMIAGSAAYLMGVAATLIKKKGANLKIRADGEILNDGPLLLTSIANGSYCGGGVMSNPYASVQDGKIDLNVIRDLGRLKFIKLFPSYKKGTHLEVPEAREIITNIKAEEVAIVPNEGTMRLCVDGEIFTAEGILFRIQPSCFRLLVPAVRT